MAASTQARSSTCQFSHRRTAALAIALAGLLYAPAGLAAGQPDAALRQAASAALLQQTAALRASAALPPETWVDLGKSDPSGRWVMGSVTEQIDGSRDETPRSKLFLARRDGQRWTVGLEGSETFFSMLEQAPTSLLAEAEKSAFRSQRKSATARPNAAPQLLAGETGLGLPWPEGVAWYMGGGPHGNSGDSRPFDSIDFSGGDGRVLAPRDGRIYKSCIRNGSAIVQLVHDNGYTTRYYHMVNLPTLADGTLVRKGAYLGQIGNGLPCGGSTTGPHVHFSLSQNGQAIAVNGKTVGGWQFFEGAQPYAGYALRNGRRVNTGGSLVNYGADQGPTPEPQPRTVTVKAPSANQLVNLRANPSLSAAVVATARNGDRIQIVCHAYGDEVNGNWGRTRLWNRLTTNTWVSDGFVDTGSNEPVVPACSTLKRP
ncbi:M23 family metallopeptidase [Chitinimonas koreensis]|uniref:M23 family metallopeptidase n=1 Tax=Chitinimonas koreensis TaxID=356302 RepID=UPI00040728A9|nr:M23 family metallopeptidase [Chitinimonas koreensis]QNM95819.1 M23 family metallopeptidase [Chitinimonas koreensis]